MKKLAVKIIAVIMCVVSVVTIAPISAFAAKPNAPSLFYNTDEWSSGYLSWTANNEYVDYYNIYFSTDGVNYSYYDDSYSAEYYLNSDMTKGLYYFYVTAVNTYYDYNNDYGYEVIEESAPSNVVSVTRYRSYTPYSYCYDGEVEWSYYTYDDEILGSEFDGFNIYVSDLSGAYNLYASVPVYSYSRATADGSYYYSFSLKNLLSQPGTYNIVVSTYAYIGGAMYCNPDFTNVETYTVYMDDPVLTTKTKSQIIKWKKVNGAQAYQIWQTKSNGKAKLIATLPANKTSYTVKKVDNYKKDYSYRVSCISNGVEFCTSYWMSASNSEARFRAAKKSKKKLSKVKVVNTRVSKTKTAWTATLSKKDRKTLDKFAKKHFKKGWTDYQKITYTMNWINKKVTYAKGGKFNKIANKTYVDAIFNKKLGQCLQYNGACAMFLTYLGYEARIVQGWRGYSKKNKWSHYWCEIKVDGRWYLVETGNHSDGLTPTFCVPYRETRGYMLNNKVAK